MHGSNRSSAKLRLHLPCRQAEWLLLVRCVALRPGLGLRRHSGLTCPLQPDLAALHLALLSVVGCVQELCDREPMHCAQNADPLQIKCSS